MESWFWRRQRGMGRRRVFECCRLGMGRLRRPVWWVVSFEDPMDTSLQRFWNFALVRMGADWW